MNELLVRKNIMARKGDWAELGAIGQEKNGKTNASKGLRILLARYRKTDFPAGRPSKNA